MNRPAFCSLLLAIVSTSFAAGTAHAVCGDDVDGTRVPCCCGDIVVSDTTLRDDDPIVSERCSADGLFVRARGKRSLRLDLAGHSLIGVGAGSGIRVLDGGEEGVVIVGGPDGEPGTVAGFYTGLRATAIRSVKVVRNLVLMGNTGDGLLVRGNGTRLEGVRAEANGRDGLRLGGRSVEVSDTRANDNLRYGLRVTAREVAGAANASGNRAGELSASAPTDGTVARLSVSP